MNREPKSVDPFNVGFALLNLDKAYNILTEVCLGYNTSKCNNLMKNIVELALMSRRNNSKKIDDTLDEYLDAYEEEYGWLHE